MQIGGMDRSATIVLRTTTRLTTVTYSAIPKMTDMIVQRKGQSHVWGTTQGTIARTVSITSTEMIALHFVKGPTNIPAAVPE